MKALTIYLKMCVMITRLTYLSGDEFQSAGPFMHPQCSVNRLSLRHLARRPKLNLNQLTMVDSLIKCPNSTLHNRHQNILNMWHTHREWGLRVKIIARRCTRNRHRRWHAESSPQPNSTLKREKSISNESPCLTLHSRHSHSWNIWRTHRVKGPQSQNHRPPMHAKLTPTMARGVSHRIQFDSE